MFLIVLVVDNPDDCGEILKVWESAGVRGATIFESTGLGRVKQSLRMDDIPIMPSLRDIFQRQEVRHRTVFSVVDDEAKVDAVVTATQSVLGDLDNENNGFLFVLPVVRAYGLRTSNKA